MLDWNYLLTPADPEDLDEKLRRAEWHRFLLGSGKHCKCGRKMLLCIEGYWCPLRWWGNFWRHTPVTRPFIDQLKSSIAKFRR